MGRQKDMVRFFTFSRYHGRPTPSGSTHIRVHQLIKYWEESAEYKYGEKPDVLIFQKVYASPDYDFPKNFPGIKILDICDPDWFEDAPVVQMCHNMDAVVVPTEELKTFIDQFHPNVKVIKDRFDLSVIPEPRSHTEPAKTVAWFGYAHNSTLLKPAMDLLEKLHLNLIIISDDDPIADRWGKRKREEFYTFVKYNEDTIYEELKKADFVVLPEGSRPNDRFKSNNKTIKANLVGLPVAKTAEDVNLYMGAAERQRFVDENYATIAEEYDVRKSVAEYKELIDGIHSRDH